MMAGVTTADDFSSELTLVVNGTAHRLRLDHRTTLLDALREHLGLTGTKKGGDPGDPGEPEDRSGHAGRGRDTGADERKPVPVRSLRQHPRRYHGRGPGGPMRPFGYLTPPDPDAAIAAVTGRPGATFLAGGTN